MRNPDSAIGWRTDQELWEYALVAYPDKEVGAKIVSEKKELEARCGLEEDKKFHPRITVAQFLAKEGMEETLIRLIQNICNLQESFAVTLNNYSGFPSSGLYLRVQTPEPFRVLANRLRILDGFLQSNDCPPLEMSSHPQLMLASGLSKYRFDVLLKEYSRKSFHESFRVDRLVLLKTDGEQGCRLVDTFIIPSPSTQTN